VKAASGAPATAAVVVIGAGAAGTAAALAARRSGAPVTVVDRGAGATVLSTGAIDFLPWESRGSAPLSPDVGPVLDELESFVVPDRAATLATTAGILRPAQGHDAALIDVAPSRGRRVAVVRCRRPQWDADALAAAWGPDFAPLDVPVLRYRDEDRIPDVDFAERHDEAARLDWLAGRLRESLAQGGWAAVVLPPSLGVDRPRAVALSERVGVPCGEALARPGVSGLRFERARDRALARAGVKRIRARVTSVEAAGGRWRVTSEDATLEAAAVVFAIGGLIAGGLEYAPSEATLATALPAVALPPVRLGLRAPVTITADGRPLDLPSSLFGIAPEDLAWPFADAPLLDRVGLGVGADGALPPEPSSATGLYAAGDVVADAPRTWGAALVGGVVAGAAAARQALTDSPGAARRASDAAPANLP
jgi:glycine/D-amino acid oxidase-like deaminating enzyme